MCKSWVWIFWIFTCQKIVKSYFFVKYCKIQTFKVNIVFLGHFVPLIMNKLWVLKYLLKKYNFFKRQYFIFQVCFYLNWDNSHGVFLISLIAYLMSIIDLVSLFALFYISKISFLRYNSWQVDAQSITTCLFL